MKRPLLRTARFVRAAKRTLRRNLALAEELHNTLAILGEDAFHSALRTHKLKGGLTGTWACSAGYDLRVLFSFVEDEGTEAILLETMGTHEEAGDDHRLNLV